VVQGGLRRSLELPAPVAADCDARDLVAVGIERLQHRPRRRERDLVLGRAAAGDQRDPNAAVAAHGVGVVVGVVSWTKWPTVIVGWFESTSTRDTLKPAACSSELAESNDWPITGGTPIGFGPLETLMRTFVPWTTCVPPGGSCAITCPCGLSELIVCGSAFRCASVSAATASVDCSPTTDGTADFGLPLETVRLTVEPLSTRVPAVGA